MTQRRVWKFNKDGYRSKVEILGQYNAEIARGIVHTKEWDEKMAELQEWFNLATKSRYI